MPRTKNPAARGVRSTAEFFDPEYVGQNQIAANTLLDIGVRRSKGVWLISIPGICVDLPISGRKLFRYSSFCKVLKHEFGAVCEPGISAFDWDAIVFSAAMRGTS